MDDHLPLTALLSSALVAFTIEFDNEAEHRLPHRTTNHGATDGSRHNPWLVSLAMWFNCMRFVDDKGVTVRELEQLARTKTNLNGMQRWGYVRVEADPADHRPKPPRSAWLVRPTKAGRQAQEVWRPLIASIEERWRNRLGEAAVNQLRESLAAVIQQLDVELPDCLPILEYGLFSRGPAKPVGRADGDATGLALPSLLSKVLLQFAIEFESESKVSLAISANVLRLVGPEGIRLRDLPRRAGVSKEGIAMAVSFLVKRGYAVVGPEAKGVAVKSLVLAPKGQVARTRYHQLLSTLEERWQTRFGKEKIDAVRYSLEQVVRQPVFLQGLEPYPTGWRASHQRPEVLPHYPMILHRGGFPDGS